MLSFTGNIEKIKQKLFLLDKSKIYDVEIKQHREKRSLNANNYCWKLCTEIASVLNNDKDSIYLAMLKRYGVSEQIAVRSYVDMTEYDIKYCEKAESNGTWDYYKIYKGSSKYDTKEMSILLNGIVSECKEMGIPTKEDLEIERMIKEWEKYN